MMPEVIRKTVVYFRKLVHECSQLAHEYTIDTGI